MPKNSVVKQLHRSLRLLASEVEDMPGVAAALRRFAAELPGGEPLECEEFPWMRRRSLRPLIYGALVDGWIDGRAFDRLMIASRRAEQLLAAGA